MKKTGLSGAALKWLALVSMLIDHAAVVFYRASVQARSPLFSKGVYLALRGVGRLAFPIYAFLLAEGVFHTRSRGRYLLRLGVFALLSELPFDLAFRRVWFDWGHQNVFFTLGLGLAALWLFQLATGGDPAGCGGKRLTLGLAAVAAMAALGHFGQTDYGVWGVLVVAVMGVLRTRPLPRDLISAGLLFEANPLEAVSYVDFALFRLYNGKRGRQPKYLFYAFYPGHLLLLSLLRRLIYP